MATSKFKSYSSTLTGSHEYFRISEKECVWKLKQSLCCNIRAIFFDLDNTLIPTRTGDKKACLKIAEILQNRYKFKKDEAIITTQNFLKSFRRCPDNIEKSLEDWRIQLWLTALPSKYKHLADPIYHLWLDSRYYYLALTTANKNLLCCLRKSNYRLALITNGTSNAQWEKINKLNIEQYFDCILISGELPWEKPNPNVFYAACNVLQVKPNECAMIGDKLETDIQGGYLAGMAATFWLPLEFNEDTQDVTNKPTFILRNLLDIYKYFNLSDNNRDVPDYYQKLKQRRSNSLPPMDYCNDETDNSSDSIN